MSAQSSKGKFKGALAQPIPGKNFNDAVFNFETASSDENIKALERSWREIELEWYIKIPLLLDHYGIDRNLPEEMRNLLLVFALAQDVVPGFMIDQTATERPKRGRPRKIPPKMLYDFAMLRQAGIGPSEAGRRLNSRGPWKGMVPQGLNARYSELDRHDGLAELARRVEEDERTK